MSQSDRSDLRALAESVSVTLDDEPAIITGWSMDFLTVNRLAPPQYGFQWSDAAVEKILLDGGSFRSW